MPALLGEVGRATACPYSVIGWCAVLTIIQRRTGGHSLFRTLKFITALPFEQYEHPLAHSFSTPGRGRGLSAVRSIGETGPRVGSLPPDGLPGSFYFAKSRNIRTLGEVFRRLEFSDSFRSP